MPWFLYSDVKENEAEKKMLVRERYFSEMKRSREDEGGNVRNFRLSAVTPVNLSPGIPPRLIIYLSGKDFKFQTFPRHIVINESPRIQFDFLVQLPPEKEAKADKIAGKFAKFFLPVQLKISVSIPRREDLVCSETSANDDCDNDEDFFN